MNQRQWRSTAYPWHAESVDIFTTSYEGVSLDAFIAALHSAGVLAVADVREAPVSRKPGFSKSALSAALSDAGIEYRHIRELGCPKPIRDRYRIDGDWARYTQSFLEHLQRQEGAVDALASFSVVRPTALLCYEADFDRCHRTYVARAVARRTGVRVCHITTSGVTTEAAGSSRAAGRSDSQNGINRFEVSHTDGADPVAVETILNIQF